MNRVQTYKVKKTIEAYVRRWELWPTEKEKEDYEDMIIEIMMGFENEDLEICWPALLRNYRKKYLIKWVDEEDKEEEEADLKKTIRKVVQISEMFVVPGSKWN